jgi:hypothetical protein
MEYSQILFGAFLGIALLLLVSYHREMFENSDTPNYCKKPNSCLGQGCSKNPNTPCTGFGTQIVRFDASDPDWGTLLAGDTVQVCVDENGAPIPSVKCATCWQCGAITPPTGNQLRRLCVPLDDTGCINYTLPPKLLDYLNKDPGALTCCGLGRKPATSTPKS